MIREDRDPGFWYGVAHHPEVWPHVSLGHDVDVAALVGNARVLPLRAEHGGFLFVELDGLGRVLELHTLFVPEGWGREVFIAAREAFDLVFEAGCQVVTTYEVDGWWRSRPPRTFRFQPAGDFAPSPFGALRTWILTRDAWKGAPARSRRE